MQYSVKTVGETLDMICAAHYGDTANYTEMVLASNPKLATLPEILPLDTAITLPEIKQAVVKTQKSLWD